MGGLEIARRMAPDAAYQLRHHPGVFLRQYWGAFRSIGTLARGLGRPAAEIQGYWNDLIVRDRIYQRVREQEVRIGLGTGSGINPGGRADAYSEVLYVILRALRPQVVVETGVALGYSSAFLLQALHDNGTGRLFSIDLPSTDPKGFIAADGARDGTHLKTAEQTGAVIPDDLRDRWELTLGSSNPLLPQLFDRLGPVDVFFHDSDHSYQYMVWEYATAWPFVRPGGALLSDDVHLHAAFPEFVASARAPWFRWFGSRGRRGAVLRPTGSAWTPPSRAP